MTEDELLAAIHADPDSVAPRLVYADWLQSRGDPLGEYIALRCQSATDAQVRARLDELGCERGWAEWFGGVRDRLWEHGMLASLGLDAGGLEPALIERLRGTLVRQLAVVGDVELDEGRVAVLRDALARMHLRRMSLSADIAPARLAELLACVPHVEELSFGAAIDDDAARVIAEAALPKLARLTISPWRRRDDARRWLGDRGAIALGERGGLVELALTNVSIGPDGAAALVSGRLPLARLDLSGNPLGGPGVVAIARGVAPLESLALAGVGLDDEGIAAIAKAPGLAGLRRLALASFGADSGLTDAQLAVLIASPHLSRELVLELDGVALRMEVFSAAGSYFSDPIDPQWVGSVPPALEARFRVEVVGDPRGRDEI